MTKKKKTIITGITGQDGSYLAEYLLGQGHEVFGLTRDPSVTFSRNIAHLQGKIKLIYTDYDGYSLIDILKSVGPDYLYNLAGQTFVSKSWVMPHDTVQSSAILPVHILEAIVRVDKGIKFFQASSCEVLAGNKEIPYKESTPINPMSPYGCSKAFAQMMVSSYRKQHGLYAVSGILFHHESPRRHETFASRKIVKGAVRIKLGLDHALRLGNLSVERDWGFAPDFTYAIAGMMELKEPLDLCICTGEAHPLETMVQNVFEILGLDYRKYVKIDSDLIRVAETSKMVGSNQKIFQELGWKPKHDLRTMLKRMVDFEMKLETGVVKDYSEERPFSESNSL